jgi:filamentous hemagglutinin family protein
MGDLAINGVKLPRRLAVPAKLLATTALEWLIVISASDVVLAQALPQGGSVVSGQARIGPPSGSGLTVVQNSSRAIIDWNSFSVGQNGSVNFIQPNASSAILNRVTGSTSSTLAGQVSGNGQVFLVNPNGIAITPTGSVQVGGGFVASTLDIGNADFNAGNLKFSGQGASASVSNAGTISGAATGFVGLIGGSVSNGGTINVPLGKVGLGSGEQATLNPTGDGFLQVALPTGAVTANGRALIDVAGSIRASGGAVEIKAATAQQAVRDAVNISGSLAARSVSGHSGNIVLDGGGGGNVIISGKLSATGGKRHAGGTIVVTGNTVRLTSSATLNASGITGGNVLVGGDLRGGLDPSAKLMAAPVANARSTVVDQGAVINANGTKGSGGHAVIWSDAATDFRGTITATGTAKGDGGAVEVSSHGVLGYNGSVDVTAAGGKTGTLLLDPYDVTISSPGPDSNMSGAGNPFSPTGNSSVLSVATLQAALATANVTVDTGAGGAQNGDITVANAVSWASGNSLTLTAARDVVVNAAISTSNGGTLNLTASRNVSVNSDITSSSGALNVNLTASSSAGTVAVSGATISTNGGNLTASATQPDTTTAITLNNAALNVGSGTGTLTGTSANGFGAFISGTSSLTASTGTITVSGNAPAPNGAIVPFGAGIGLAASTALTTAGAITLNGTGGTSGNGHGISLQSGATVTSSGSLTLQGTTASNVTNRFGVYFVAGNSITATSGNVSVIGTASTSGQGIEQSSGSLCP